MSHGKCGIVRELIPDLVANRLSAADAATVEGHLPACAECNAELDLVRAVLAGRRATPEGLSERVVVAVRLDRRLPSRPWWGISAAAVAALALGIGISSQPAGDGDVDVPGYAYEVEEGELWLSDDGLLAGAPSLDVLSDEALEQLLDELVVGSAGGAA